MRKRILLAICCVFTTLSLFAQGNWGGGVDEEKQHWGYIFQYIAPEFKILKNANWRDPYFDTETSVIATDSLYSISAIASKGFGLGFVSDVRLGENANLRFTPALSFTERVADYRYANPAQDRQQKVAATTVDLPLGIKLKSDRRNNFRAYLLVGTKYSIDIISKAKTDDTGNIALEKLLKNNRTILSYEAGFGFDFYFEFFKMSPELKLSNSFNSVLKRENNPYSTPIDKLFLRSLQLSLYLE
jgi:Outer membrane protein beta-barrel domain